MTQTYTLLSPAGRPLVGYLQALGLLHILAESHSPSVTMRWASAIETGGRAEAGYTFEGIDEDGVRDLFATKWRPSHCWSPWNKASHSGGHTSQVTGLLRVARELGEPMAEYVRVIDRQREGGLVADKDALVKALVSGSRCDSPSHTRWARACWRLVPAETPRGREAISPRPLLGSGGNEGRMDYAALYLRACCDHFAGVAGLRLTATETLQPLRGRTPGVPAEPYPLGGMAFPELNSLDCGFDPALRGWPGGWTGQTCPDALSLILLLEGAMVYSYPHPVLEGPGGLERDAWAHRPGAGRPPRMLLWLPVWREPLTARDALDVLAGGWDGRAGCLPSRVWSAMLATWKEDGKLLRASASFRSPWDGDEGWPKLRHRYLARIRMARSREECSWLASVDWSRGDESGCVLIGGRPTLAGALAAAKRYCRQTFGRDSLVRIKRTVRDADRGKSRTHERWNALLARLVTAG